MTLFKLEWRNQRKGMLIWTIVIGLVITLFMSVFPAMQSSEMKDVVTSKMDAFPEALTKIVNLQDAANLMHVAGFFSYIFQYLFIAACIYATLLGAQALIKEETDGTIEWLYAQPITRNAIILWKLLASLMTLFIFWFLTYIVTTICFAIFKESGANLSSAIEQLTRIFVNDFLILLFFLVLGFCLSSLLSSSKQVNGAAMGSVFGFYLLGILSDLKDNLAFLGHFSPVHMGIPAKILTKNITGENILILFIAIIVLLLATLIFYKRKDLKI